jgi:GH15 family glucan-1,4-alpha-glucosidase
MWEAQRRLRGVNCNEQDLGYAKQIFDWVLSHQYLSGVLAEQLNPYTAESRSATPLVWSHAVFVETTLHYLAAMKKLNQVPDTKDPGLHEL